MAGLQQVTHEHLTSLVRFSRLEVHAFACTMVPAHMLMASFGALPQAQPPALTLRRSLAVLDS